jgi:hypothetical protein
LAVACRRVGEHFTGAETVAPRSARGAQIVGMLDSSAGSEGGGIGGSPGDGWTPPLLKWPRIAARCPHGAGEAVAGTLTIKVYSSGKKVIIDGVALGRV